MIPQLLVGQQHRAGRAAERADRPGQHAVVRTDQDPAPGLDRDRAARGSHARINDRDVHGGRHRRDRLGEHRRPAPHVAWRHQVRDIDDSRGRSDPRGYPVAGGDETVFEPEVGEERKAAQRGHILSAYVPAMGDR